LGVVCIQLLANLFFFSDEDDFEAIVALPKGLHCPCDLVHGGVVSPHRIQDYSQFLTQGICAVLAVKEFSLSIVPLKPADSDPRPQRQNPAESETRRDC